ncbi:hypothetical protein V8J88_22685 [Massilia sp. W12]|uniref:hypothetical protein n=1 Tax=Massilia sp. W12 TaxID=3126507 RepID=UPI0030D0865D
MLPEMQLQAAAVLAGKGRMAHVFQAVLHLSARHPPLTLLPVIGDAKRLREAGENTRLSCLCELGLQRQFSQENGPRHACALVRGESLSDR